MPQELPARKRSSQATDSVSRWLVCRAAAAHVSQQQRVCRVPLAAPDMKTRTQLCFDRFVALSLLFKTLKLYQRPSCAVMRHCFCLTP